MILSQVTFFMELPICSVCNTSFVQRMSRVRAQGRNPRSNRRHRRRSPSVPSPVAVLPLNCPSHRRRSIAVPFYQTAVGALLWNCRQGRCPLKLMLSKPKFAQSQIVQHDIKQSIFTKFALEMPLKPCLKLRRRPCLITSWRLPFLYCCHLPIGPLKTCAVVRAQCTSGTSAR